MPATPGNQLYAMSGASVYQLDLSTGGVTQPVEETIPNDQAMVDYAFDSSTSTHYAISYNDQSMNAIFRHDGRSGWLEFPVSGLSTPMSLVFDPSHRRLLVADMVGDMMESHRHSNSHIFR